ncbi:MAG TPA: NADH-quinone oxidoreductase subunit N [Planctomycetaceae bacterium]|nr:NADH-quinone oxidoreductase subunit N [Planctomycetaceae bacterium]HQZ63859.1 NADH-quinone oxidoreductase subunit N [Planctomycetaceae bacterium]HRA87234.1 NADH-quinone oxidoreductase subunit N [Planctomycetaceae bacterium]
MLFPQLLQKLIDETTGLSIPGFSVELCLSATIVAMLMMRLVNLDRLIPASVTAVIGAFAALIFTWLQFRQIGAADAIVSQKIFTGLLIHDTFTVYFRAFLSLFLLLTVALTSLTGIPDNEDGPDFYSLLFGATIGMMIMASANNLLMVFVGIEMASVPSYAMVGFLKGRKPSSEAALKYVVYGAGAAGVMLYGISLIAGVLGTTDMSLLAERLGEAAAGGAGGLGNPALRAVSLGILLVMVGISFKLSLVPFHFWCPDAFEGASAEVAGFLSVASKAGAFGLLVRFVLALTGAPGTESLMIAFGVGIGFIACVTTTFGNLAAYAQTNLKRLLAYSTIAHAGYMVMAVSAMMVMANSSRAGELQGYINRSVEGLLYYLFVYLFMNLGAFAVVAIARNHTFSEEVDSFKGLVSQSPTLCIVMLICMFSLVGMPPFGGFVGKLMIFASAFKAGEIHWFMYVVVVFGALNTVFSLVYYIRVLKTMFLDARPADARPVPVQLGSLESIYVVSLAAFVLLLGILPQFLSSTAGAAAQSLAKF